MEGNKLDDYCNDGPAVSAEKYDGTAAASSYC